MDEDFKVDYGQLESYARWLMSYDIGDIAVNVDTGEGLQLYLEEHVNILNAFSEVVKRRVPIIGSGGVSTWEDVVEFILVGASAVQLCTAIVIKGLGWCWTWSATSGSGWRKGVSAT